VLRSDAVDRQGRLYALIGRSTFSAAVNFATELERDTSVVFVGEPTGGSSNLYADTMPVEVLSLGVAVKISTRYWEKSTPGDPRLAIEPDLPVPLTVEDWLAGRDPVLAAALS
jgi:C-terminal processing protease CtpA/Prc